MNLVYIMELGSNLVKITAQFQRRGSGSHINMGFLFRHYSD
jgi:hypothetical protein